MADTPKTNETKPQEGKAMTRENLMKTQTEYQGNSHFDLVEVKIIKDGDFYKEGEVDQVHPATAAILKAKGLIADDGKSVTRKEFETKDIQEDGLTKDAKK